jgi:hypothetical protein
VEFYGDGTFSLLVEDESYDLAPATGASGSGTFTVVDASKTLARARSKCASASDFVAAETWRFRAGVCGPAFGPEVSTASNDDLVALMQGRWIWCSGPGEANPIGSLAASHEAQPSPFLGLTISGDTWQALVEDETGALVAAPEQSGTFQLAASGASWVSGSTMYVDPLPMVDTCGRTMLLSPAHVCALGGSPPCPVDVAASDLLVRAP